MKKIPLISVIIPTHSSVNTIKESIESIINQTYPNIEVIVIGDNVTYDAKEIIEEIQKENPTKKISYYPLLFDDPNRLSKTGRNINAGYSARNYGLEKAKGEWVTFQDADDISFLNRIEVQYNLAIKHNSNHLCITYQKYDPKFIGKKLDVEKILNENKDLVINSESITRLAKKNKGLMMSLLGSFHKFIPFEIKTMRIINKLFFRSLDPYPASGNCPLVKKEVFEKVKFRPRDERVWPSFVGRGADRDFNFQVAETFKKNIVFKLPLYLWRS